MIEFGIILTTKTCHDDVFHRKCEKRRRPTKSLISTGGESIEGQQVLVYIWVVVLVTGNTVYSEVLICYYTEDSNRSKMASRVVSRLGKDAPKYLQFLRPATGTMPQAAAPSMSTMFLNQARTASQIGLSNTVRFLSDKTTPPPPPPEGEEKPAAEDAAAAPSAEGEPAAAEEPAEPEVSREEQLEEELKQAKDQLLRSLAEQENTRRIAKRDVADARNFAVKSFAKSLLEVSDNLSRALEHVPEDMRHDKENHQTLATLYEGIAMTETGLTKAFEMNGLKKFCTVGDDFDPNKHNALYEYPDSEKKPGTVGQVIKAGYLLNDRVLRPAEVGVVKKEG